MSTFNVFSEISEKVPPVSGLFLFSGCLLSCNLVYCFDSVLQVKLHCNGVNWVNTSNFQFYFLPHRNKSLSSWDMKYQKVGNNKNTRCFFDNNFKISAEVIEKMLLTLHLSCRWKLRIHSVYLASTFASDSK